MPRTILIRHGESQLNVTNKTVRTSNGAAETPLTEKGIAEAIEAGRWLADQEGLRLDMAVSSTITRSVHTAQLALRQLPYYVPLSLSSFFRERTLGVFDGEIAEEVFAALPQYRDDPELKEFVMHFIQKAPGGENLTEVTERAWPVLEEFERKCGGNLAIFTHATTIRCLVGKALRLSQEQIINLDIPNATPIVLERGDSHRLVSGLEL